LAYVVHDSVAVNPHRFGERLSRLQAGQPVEPARYQKNEKGDTLSLSLLNSKISLLVFLAS